VQYGNIQPEYEVEAPTFEEAEKVALPYIENLWARYCQQGSELRPRTVTTQNPLVEMTSSMTPGKALFDEVTHTYYNDKNEKLLSGSKFAHKYQHEFKKAEILVAMEKKFDIPSADIAKMWELKSKVSMDFGNSLHGALEMYGKYMHIGKTLGAGKKPIVNTALHDHPIIQKVVEEFYKGRENDDAIYEEFVVDEKRNLCGQLDRVLIVNRDKKICRVQDFKTNANVEKKGFNHKLKAPFDNLPDTPLGGYWLQLSFYSDILKKAGWKVEAMDVFAYNGKWTTYTKEPIDLSKVI
jgi:hypothetical protein